MSTPTSVTWQMDGHTGAKHVILKRYLEAWMPILTRGQAKEVLLIDGFAGPGEYDGGQVGSPLIMIETFLGHKDARTLQGRIKFLFIEDHSKRHEHLQELVERRKQEMAFPTNMRYEFYRGKFHEAMKSLLADLKSGVQNYDAMFVFIDPFGYSHIPMSIIQELMSYPRCEVLITLMSEEINRFLGADYRTKDQQYDELFGTTEWRKIAAGAPDPKERMKRQHDLYQNQLISMSGAKYVRSFRMRNKHNATDYFLFFGTKSLLGLKKMKEAMWNVDPTGAYDFSDYTNPYQSFLPYEPNHEDLSRMLSKQFKGRTVSMEEIEEYVIAQTPYYLYKKEALKPMELAKEIVVKVTEPDYKRRVGSFKEGKVLVQFL